MSVRTDRIVTSWGDEDKEFRFSHVVSTPQGNYVVFAEVPFTEEFCVEIYKLVNVEEESPEEDMVNDAWVEMTEALCGEPGFAVFTREDD